MIEEAGTDTDLHVDPTNSEGMNEREKKDHPYRSSEVPTERTKEHVSCLKRLEKSVNQSKVE